MPIDLNNDRSQSAGRARVGRDHRADRLHRAPVAAGGKAVDELARRLLQVRHVVDCDGADALEHVLVELGVAGQDRADRVEMRAGGQQSRVQERLLRAVTSVTIDAPSVAASSDGDSTTSNANWRASSAVNARRFSAVGLPRAPGAAAHRVDGGHLRDRLHAGADQRHVVGVGTREPRVPTPVIAEVRSCPSAAASMIAATLPSAALNITYTAVAPRLVCTQFLKPT